MISEADVATTFKTCSNSGPVGGAQTEGWPRATHTHPREQLHPPSRKPRWAALGLSCLIGWTYWRKLI